MEEELNENELEERFYSMLHYVDDSQANVSNNQDALKIFENAPRSTVRRYWRTSGDLPAAAPLNTPFQKVNIPREAPKPPVEEPKPKEEKQISAVEPLPKHLSLFNSPVPKDIRKSIEILENEDNNVVELESSDEDEVIEVALPPKPTITIESSDDEISIQDTPTKGKRAAAQNKGSKNGEREISASPVPSIVSSVSDEFIRSDCIAFNISSRRPENHSFDFSLHGADILGSTPSKKKKKKKNKESATSTPISVESTQNKSVVEECFATPKSKAKNKKQKNKSYVVTEKSVPNADVYDSDSNQSIIETNKKGNSYVVTEKSLPSADVYETDSNPSETPQHNTSKSVNHVDLESSDSSISLDKSYEGKTTNSKKDTPQHSGVTIDLTQNIPDINDVSDDIEENIVMGNVTGFTESEDYGEESTVEQTPVHKFGSTKVPAILYENLDFDNLKGKEKVCKNRRYSLSTLRAEMEKFYNESWGGEDFNHREIQKNMSRDKSLWAIDPKDRMGSYTRKKYNVTCNYCNRPGHRDDTCRLKPPVCFMCGNPGHMEPRCPSKICVNCGSPNHMYSTMCRNCCHWARVRCAECGQHGHPHTHCPDTWRRYHNTTDITPYLEENRFTKKHHQLFCSGCTRRGHLVHTCRLSLPFSGLPINSPYVSLYRPVYAPEPDTNTPDDEQNDSRAKSKSFQDSVVPTTPRNDRNKRQSKSPTVHEAHVNKKRNVSMSEITEQTPKSSLRQENQRKRSQSKEPGEEEKENVRKRQDKTPEVQSFETMEKAPDFIPIFSSNHDKKGQVIQDNEVSDTSDVITSARIYVTADVIEKLKSNDGEEWLKETTEKLHIVVEKTDSKSFLSIKGKVGDQEAFQTALKDWAKDKSEQTIPGNGTDSFVMQQTPNRQTFFSDDIPRARCNALRRVTKALESLNKDLGEPNGLYKELNYLQNRHQNLLKQKVISSKQVENNRAHINAILKKLNMVLLGQAGLADGSKHIRELYILQEKLVNHRTKNISPQMRQNIGEHFHSIFTALPRDDYEQLLQRYNMRNQTKPSFQNKKKPFNLNSKPKKFDTIPVQNQQKNQVKEVNAGNGMSVNSNNNAGFKKPLAQITMGKLAFFRQRLLRARPTDSVLKKTRGELVRKLHTFINSLGRNPKTSAKNLKKMRKVQEQAQQFLNNV